MPLTLEEETKLKKRAASLSVVSNSTLIVMKLIAGAITGSFSIISEAIHSLSDLLASIIAFFAVKKASMPADKDHDFGHGKYEDFSGLIEGILIIGAAIYIVYESVDKIIMNHHSEISVNAAIYVMFFSVIVNIFVSAHLFKVAKRTGSVAIFADAEHLRTDVYTSVGVMLGLVLIKYTGLHLLDPLIAMFVAVLILQAGLSICRKTVANLLDTSLSAKEEDEIKNAVYGLKTDTKFSIKEIKTRRSGARVNIEMTICVNGNTTVSESHNFCNKVENILSEKIGNTDTVIHIEPTTDSVEQAKQVKSAG